jgi:hypothetical protein
MRQIKEGKGKGQMVGTFGSDAESRRDAHTHTRTFDSQRGECGVSSPRGYGGSASLYLSLSYL